MPPARRPTATRVEHRGIEEDPYRDSVYSVCMARVNVYLPEDLAERAKRADLNVSALAQDAVSRALGAQETNAWLAARTASASSSVAHDAALEALDAVRDEAGTRHG